MEALEVRTLLSGLTPGLNLNISQLAGNQSESAIAVNPNNPLELFTASVNSGGGLFAARSVDGGLTWLPSNGADFIIADGSDSLGTAGSDPTLAWDSFGNLILGYITAGTPDYALATSTNGGATFNYLGVSGVGGSQPAMTVGPGQGGIDQALWLTFDAVSLGNRVAFGVPITGLGAFGSFNSFTLTGMGEFGDIAIGSDGQVTVVGQTDTAIQIMTDPDGLGPAPFGSVVTATTTNVARNDLLPAQPTRGVSSEAGIVYDRSTGRYHGRLYLIYTDETVDENHNFEILVRTSDDNGATWGAAVRVNDDATTRSQFLPKIALDQTTGTVGAVWYDARNSATNTQVQVFGSASDNGGASWARNTLISQGTSDGTVAATGTQQLGDYLGLTFQNGILHPTWADNSNRTFNNPEGALQQLDLYTASVTVGAWVSQGPAPGINGQEDVPPDDQINGAVQAIAVDPSNPDIMYVGSVNGGVWKTTNATAAAPHWVSLTDNLRSLSIAALELDPTDATHQTLIAGSGTTSSYFLGDEFRGLLRSTDGGLTWTELGTPTFANQNVISVAARGSILLAGTDNAWGGGGSGGLYRSTNGGANWTLVSGTSGLTATGNVSDIVGDPVDPNTFYVAVRGNGGGVFRSTDAGANWTNVTSGIGIVTSSTTKIELAVHNNAGTTAVFAIVANNSATAGVFRSLNGAAFTTLDLPALGDQAFVHLSIAAHPTNSNFVFVGGAGGVPYGSNYIARLDASAASGSQITYVVNGTFNAPHVDTREMVIDPNGNLLLGTDGGLFRLNSPTTNGGSWSSILGDISIFEAHNVAYDSLSNIIMIGTQDNGTLSQLTPDGLRWDHPGFGDGGDVAIDDVSLAGSGQSIRYFSSQSLGGWTRLVYDSNNNLVSSAGLASISDPSFTTPFELNVVDPTRVLVGGSTRLYESFNRGTSLTSLTSSGANGNVGGPMVYGGFQNGVPNAELIYSGIGNQVHSRTTAGAPVSATGALPGGAGTVRDVTVDADNWMTVFAIDSNQVFMSIDGGGSWTDITGNLTTISQADFWTLAYVSGAADDGLVIGTDSGVFTSQLSTIGTWRRVSDNLPNVIVYDLEYDATDDVLVAGTMGRGAWSLPEARYNVIGLAGIVGVTVAESDGSTRVAEGSLTDTYTIGLQTVPSGPVQITVVADAQTEISTDGINFFSSRVLSFTGSVPQTITVRALDDATAEGTHSATITQSITNSADPDYPVGLNLPSVNVAIDDNELSPFQRLEPLGSLIAFSTNNSGSLTSAVDQRDFTFFAQAGETLAAFADPTSTELLSIELLGVSGTFTSGTPGASIALPPQAVPADGQYTIRITGSGATDFTLLAYLNAAIESQVGDSSNGSELAITNSLIQVGSGRFAVVGTSAPINIPQQFSHYNNPSRFIDISGTGTPLGLGDDGEATITSSVGNVQFPAGSVTIGNNGGIIAGGSQQLDYSNQGLPTTAFGNALLPYWDDIDSDTGNVYWQVRTVGGINTLIVQWENRPHFDVGGSVTFQLQLFASGPVLARYAYEDVIFGNSAYDAGAQATIGFQRNTTTASLFSLNTPVLANGDVVDLNAAIFVPETDEYTIDLTGMAGHRIDVVLKGLDGADFTGQTLELLGTNGITVLATGVVDPAQAGVNATNHDLTIPDFIVPANGVYTVRLRSNVAGDYTIVVTDSMTFDTEANNDPATNPLRNLTNTEDALGYVSTSDLPTPRDTYRVTLSAGQAVSVFTTTPFDSVFGAPLNTLDPEVLVIHPDGTTIVAADLNSAADGKNVEFSFAAPVAGSYLIRVSATSGSGEYFLHVGPDVTAPILIGLSPPDDSVDVDPTTNLVVTFNEPMAKGTGNILIKDASNDATIQTIDVTSAAVTVAGNQFTIDLADLASNTAYYVIVPASAFKDLGNNDFAGITIPTSWNFITADVAPPLILLLSPPDNDVDVPVTTNLVMTFNEAITKGVGNILIRSSNDDSVVQTIDVLSTAVTIAVNEVTVDLADLGSSTGYYVEVPAGAFQDLANNPFAGIAGPTTWNFITADILPPVLLSLSPTDGAINVAITTDLVLTFNENIVQGTGNILVRRLSDNSIAQSVAVTSPAVSITGAVVTVTLADLEIGTDYYVEVPNTALRDLSNNNFAGISGSTAWNFMTSDNVLPVITSSATASVPENTPVLSVILDVNAVDSNIPAQTLTYSLSGVDAGLMSIDPATGEIRFTALRDYEAPADQGTNNVYNVTVTVTDNGVPNLSTSQALAITVTPVNDNAPLISSADSASAVENTSTATVVLDVNATDADLPVQGLTYSLSGPDALDFTINGATGEIRFASVPNFDAPADQGGDNVYNVTVTVADDGLPGQQATQDLTITVTNVNDNGPVINSSASASVPENTLTTTVVLNVDATDADVPAQLLSYSLSGPDAAAFTIDGATGEIRFANVPDFEAPADQGGNNEYNVTVTVLDDGVPQLSTTQDISIFVTAVNDNLPIISSPATASVPENTLTSTVVLNVNATDTDLLSQTLTYSLSGSDAGAFNINSATGEITFANSPDFEAAIDVNSDNIYEITVTVADDVIPVLTTSQALTITVTAVNDNAPQFTSSATASIPENTPASTVVLNVDASDDDLLPQALSYSLTGPDAAQFTINNSTGEIRFVTSPNFEAPTDQGGDHTYNVTVTAVDNGSPPLSTSQVLVITVTAVNDIAPVISSNATASVPENSSTALVVLDVNATDADVPAQSLTYDLSGPDAALFNINASTGQITFAASPNFEVPLDQGNDNIYNVTVTVTDNVAPTLSTSQSLAITVTNVNEAPTDLNLSATAVAENQPVGTVIGSFSSSDVDAGDTFTYALVTGAGSADNARFTLVGGQLRTAGSFDFETKSSYSIRVRSTDAGGLIHEKVLTITVLDGNDNPTNIALSSNTVIENQPAGTTVGTLSSTDQDIADTFTYSLVSGAGGADNGNFIILGDQIQAAASFNFEAKSSHSIRVRTTDAGGLFVDRVFVVNVSNLNEQPTDVALSKNTVAENQPSGAIVGSLITTDQDFGDAFSYQLVSGVGSDDNVSFVLVGGQLQTAETFDFETRSSYSIRVRTTDLGGLSIEKVLTVGITNVNEQPTAFALSTNTVAEDQPSGTPVGTFSTTDIDFGDTFTYSLVLGTGSADNNRFAIVGNQLQTATTFDFEAKSSYSIRVRSMDAGGLFIFSIFTINVTNVNDAPLDITISPDTIAENQAPGTTVGTFNTTDADSGETFTYSLVAGAGSTNNSSFAIVGGQLQAAAALDFEAQTMYSIRVRSTDSGGLTTEKALTINVANVNEQPTDLGLSATTVAENRAVGTAVGTLSSVDPDFGETFTYALVSGVGSNDNASFTLIGGQLQTAASFDFETKSIYSVRIRSTDASGLFTEKVFTINVTNVNETPTNIAVSPSSVAENQLAGATVGALSTTDQDAGDTFTYALVPGAGSADNASFVISGSEIQTTASFNFETKSNYSVRVRSTDAAGLSTERILVITVANVNEAPVALNVSNSTIDENQPIDTLVGTLTSTDADAGDAFTYSLVSGAGDEGNAAFAIMGDRLQAAQPFDFETQASYSIRVRSTDANGLSVDQVLTIQVADVSDPPIVELSGGAVTLPNGKGGTIDPGSNAFDQDTTNFNNNRIVVTIQPESRQPKDRLRLIPNGKGDARLKAAKGNLKVGKVVVGAVTGGRDGEPLSITFTQSTDATMVQQVLRQIGFKTHASPGDTRRIEFQMFDSAGDSNPPVVKDVTID